jgi:hypothetical protein
MIDSTSAQPSCSFCGKSQDEVRTLIAGRSAYICEVCVVSCVGALKDKGDWPAVPVRLLHAIRYWLGGRREST